MKETELTFRGLVLGFVIAAIFTAANIYLGLKAGITIASSIPAAVISMGILRALNTGTIRENNIVQTVASAGGTLSAIIFVLPGLVMIGWWREFPFLETFLVCALGGILGVMFSIPLRRALVVNSPLPYPEGVAAAEVLKVGARADEAPANVVERTRGPVVVLYGAIIAAVMQVSTYIGAAAAGFEKYFRVGAGVSGVSTSFSMALVGAGHLVGISVGVAMLIGLLIAWVGIVPWYSSGLEGDAAELAGTTRGQKARFIGAGVIGIAAIWSLFALVKPVYQGLMATMRARAAEATGGHDDRDLSVAQIGALSLICLLAIGWLIYRFVAGGPLEAFGWPLVVGGVVFTVIVGAFIATVAGYMAGLIGASNSPVSGIGILSIIAASLLLVVFIQPYAAADATNALIAVALFAVAIVFSIATISNDNLQDLKTGHLVGASPWKQQVALIIGVIAGSLVTPWTLNILNTAYGFPGDPNRAAITAEPLGAPQATLISTLAKGVLNADIDWSLIGLGVIIGIVIIAIDEILGFMKRLRIPPMAVGIGIYLPMDTTSPVILGAVLGWLYTRAISKSAQAPMLERFGVLLASGWIVGESLLGIFYAGAIVASGNATPLALVKDFALAPVLGPVLFAALLAFSYNWVSRQARGA
jgi:putative OPT family oligopeptide transporter